MGWCDKMPSTPAVGFRFDRLFATNDQIIRAFEPILNRWTAGEKIQFELEEKGPLSASLVTDDGIKITVEPKRIYVEFNYRVKLHTGAGAPRTEIVSNPKIYSEQLDICCNQLMEACDLLKIAKIEKLMRIGIVSNTTSYLEDFPPGIQLLNHKLSSVLSGEFFESHCRIASIITDDDKLKDRCIHTIAVKADPTELATVSLDWQREFQKPLPTDNRTLSRSLTDAKNKALEYFEQLGEGQAVHGSIRTKN